MNLDDFKNKWDQQKNDELHINRDLNNISSMNDILDNIKKEHKKGLVMRGASMLILLFFPLWTDSFFSNLTLIFYYFFLTYLIISTLYTIFRYHQFVKSSDDYEVTSSLSHLVKVYYSYKYYSDTNVLASVIDTPSGIGLLFILLAREKSEYYFNKLIAPSSTIGPIPSTILVILAIILLCIIIVCCMVYWLHQKNDRQKLSAIKQVINELEQ
jgi:MFS superfamily sulfate permease-like transporter